jgi:hypothetical protein
MASREFSSISVSSYDAASLADRLTEKSAEGWEVVAIVPAGTNVTAYLARASTGLPGAATTTVDSAARSGDTAGAASGAASGVAAGASTAAATGSPQSATSPWSQSGTSGAVGTATGGQVASQTAAAVSEASAPAGWYADPAGRFELRYWDGGQWTEHVSRAGQQYTDPPVA